MAGMNTLQITKTIPKLDGENPGEWTNRSLNDILQIAWPLLSKIIYELESPEPILSGRTERKENTSDLDDNDSNPSDVSDPDPGSLNEEPHNSDENKAWDSANEHLFSVSRLTTTGAARRVLLKFERKNDRPGNSRQAWLALKNRYQNTSCQHRRTRLRCLDDSMMRSDIDPDVFLSAIVQLRDELSDLVEAVSDEFLTTIILDALPEDMYSTI